MGLASRLDRVSPYRIAIPRFHLVGRDSVEPSASKLINDALVRPVLWLLHQTRSHRIRPNVFPFLGVALLIPQTMMEAVYLKTRRTIAELRPEFTSPKCDPTLDRHVVTFREQKK